MVTFARATRDLKGKGLELGVVSADEPSSSALRCNGPSRIQGPTSTNRRDPKPARDTCLVIPAAHLRVDGRTLLKWFLNRDKNEVDRWCYYRFVRLLTASKQLFTPLIEETRCVLFWLSILLYYYAPLISRRLLNVTIVVQYITRGERLNIASKKAS